MSIGILFDARKSPTTIAGDFISIDLDVMMDETHEWTADVVTNPVENGSPISDHIRLMPDKLTINGMISDAPLNPEFGLQFPGAIDGGTYSARMQTHFEMLRELMAARLPVVVYTRYKSYTDMAITSINIARSSGIGECLPFTMQFTNINIVNTQIVDVPPGISSKLDKKIGTDTQRKAQPKADAGKKETIAKDDASFIKVMKDTLTK